MRQHAQAWLAGLFALIVGAASVAAASSYSNTVNVGPYQGAPMVLRNGREIPVTVGMTLQARDRIITDGRSRLAVDMGEDSMLMVGADSEVELTALHVSDADRGGIKAIVSLPRGVARFMTPVPEVKRPRRIRMVLGEAKYRIGKDTTDVWFKHANPTNVGCLFDGAIEVFIQDDKVADVGDPRFCFIHNLSADELPIRVIDEDQQRALVAQTDIVPDTIMVAAAPQRDIQAQPIQPIVPAKPALVRPKPVAPKLPVRPKLPQLPAPTEQAKTPSEPVKSTQSDQRFIAASRTSEVEPIAIKTPQVQPLPDKPSRLSYARAEQPRSNPRTIRQVSKALTPEERVYKARLKKARAAALRFVKARGYTPLEVSKSEVVPRVAAVVPTNLPAASVAGGVTDWRMDTTLGGVGSATAASRAAKSSVAPKRPAALSPRVVRQPALKPKPRQAQPTRTRPQAVLKPRAGRSLWHVNLASFSRRNSADRLARKLQRLEVPVKVMSFNSKGRTLYRVYLDVNGQRKDAERAGNALVGNFGIRGYWVKRK